jgi:hypothetical protein
MRTLMMISHIYPYFIHFLVSGRHGIVSMIEKVPVSYANKAMTRLEKNDVKFRFVCKYICWSLESSFTPSPPSQPFCLLFLFLAARLLEAHFCPSLPPFLPPPP